MISLDGVKGYHKNPRKITEKQFTELRDSLHDLGDLSGIIINYPTKEIIGGNMRSKVLEFSDNNLVLTKEYAEPTNTGTIAEGYMMHEGERYNIRFVIWTSEQCELANIRANKMGGSFDYDMLFNGFDESVLLNSGFSIDELTGRGFEELEEEFEKAESEFQEQIEDHEKEGIVQNAVIISFKTSEEAQEGYEELKEMLKHMFPEAILSLYV